MSFRNVSVLSAALLLAVFSTVVGSRAALAAATPIRVSYIPIVDCLPLYVAKDRGFFEKRGLDVSLTAVANQSVVISSLVSGSAEIGTSVPTTILQAAEAGIDTVIIAGARTFPIPQPLDVGVLARTGSGIESAKDLVGKKIAVAGLKAYHDTMVKRWLTEKGVDPDRVNFVEVSFPQMGDVLKAGQVDAVVSVDPFFHRIIAAKTGYLFDNFVATVPDGTLIDFYAAPKSWAAGHKDEVAKFRDALREAIAAIKSDDAGARESLARWTKQPEAVVKATHISDYNLPVTAEQIQFWIDLSKKYHLVSTDLKAADFLPAQ